MKFIGLHHARISNVQLDKLMKSFYQFWTKVYVEWRKYLEIGEKARYQNFKSFMPTNALMDSTDHVTTELKIHESSSTIYWGSQFQATNVHALPTVGVRSFYGKQRGYQPKLALYWNQTVPLEHKGSRYPPCKFSQSRSEFESINQEKF